MIPTIYIEPAIVAASPAYTCAWLTARVTNKPTSEALWNELSAVCQAFLTDASLETLTKQGPILAMRQLYKKLGKDPNRYRPSAEALCRRLLLGKELYRINGLVDIINGLSIRTGFSIGGFDADKVEGSLTIGVGRAGEPFEAIGRGILNIEGLPVYRDAKGAIGTPTSDVERTKLSLETTRLLLILHSAGGPEGLVEALREARRLLVDYSEAVDIEEGFCSYCPVRS
ncbi:MAG: B3/4 domain protein [Bacteroidetes bacterium ADurb.Bin416]|jgi:DNA/RNA-binding domain of Phe-tRNA-synthetase-like protein|nr:MAG: B3/4 domain protein [Bacteroidetes bacterium ADurb.Bin416]